MTDEEPRIPLFTIGFKLDGQGNLVMDTFHAYDGFMDLSIDMQHALINGVMEELGERPVYTGGGISLN
ncbi:hypothetical protein KA005_60100 [bacterium]|nr:hypothetical protein [bacterium]